VDVVAVCFENRFGHRAPEFPPRAATGNADGKLAETMARPLTIGEI
jgi:hypothetical protein